MQRFQGLTAFVAISCFVISGCTQVSTGEHLKNGDRLAASNNNAAAIIEYRAAVKEDERNGTARLKLGRAYAKDQNWSRAADELARAADLLPGDDSAQIDTARALLKLGRFEDARSRAEAVLKKNPKNVEAHVLRAGAAAGLRDADGALNSLTEAVEADPARSLSYVDLGLLQSAQGNRPEAEAAFKQAVVVGPTSIPAHLALANFYLSSTRLADGEKVLQKIITLEPKNVQANVILARLYLSTGREREAEVPLRRIGDETAAPGLRLTLADYYVSQNRKDEARSILQRLLEQPESAAAASARLAAIEYESGRPDAARKMIDDLLAKQPNAQLNVLKGRWLLAERKPRQALDAAAAAVKLDPRSSAAWVLMGSTQLTLNDPGEAEKAFTEALRVNPRSADAQRALANFRLAQGQPEQAVSMARQALALSPTSLTSRMSLANALFASGDVNGAASQLEVLLRAAPTSASVLTLQGRIHERKGNLAAARTSFAKALDIQPDSVDVLRELINIDLREKRRDRAVQTLEKQLAKVDKNAALQLLAGRTYGMTGDLPKAEAALRKAMELDPTLVEAYHALGQIFIRQNKLDQAKLAYQQRIAERPQDVASMTMIGMVELTQGHGDAARASFEKVLSIDPRAAVASNNLAFMDAEAGTNLDIALNRAQTAKAARPDDPDIDDTLGWIYVKKGLPALAISPLENAVQKNPSNAVYHYHLGTAYLRRGDSERAKTLFERALRISSSFQGASEAKRALDDLAR